jgi:hypothetical protein
VFFLWLRRKNREFGRVHPALPTRLLVLVVGEARHLRALRDTRADVGSDVAFGPTNCARARANWCRKLARRDAVVQSRSAPTNALEDGANP